MSETLHSSSTESMKKLTEKVLKADLASRKKRMFSIKAAKLYPILLVPFAYYAVKVKIIFN